jgi:hypothetical protein
MINGWTFEMRGVLELTLFPAKICTGHLRLVLNLYQENKAPLK